ncbi:hypothetical protein NLJ89_g781 [Agrocybe chaxingu]|uniref:Cytochrome P450 n=1 Tax=Agrocybe chaxingu TaxID=84603 RepID=A0A9W8TED1_9AGAR|nr:hypothetical protein NLJ89_g781 [Agrocybe chaxingu]
MLALDSNIIIDAAAAISFIILIVFLDRRSRYRLPLPPGPPRPFLSDNRRDVPVASPWKTFTAWQKEYGDVVSIQLGCTPVIILNSIKAAIDLLEKRGNIYSSRPRHIVGGEIYSGGMRGIGMPYGQRWRNWRLLMNTGMGVEASQGYKPLQDSESKIMLRDLLNAKSSSERSSFVRRFVISVVFFVSYGRRISSMEVPTIQMNEEIEHFIISVPGKHLVESRSLQWFRWKYDKQRERETKFYLELMESVRERMAENTAHACTSTKGLEKQEQFGMSDVELAYGLSSPGQAGVGTNYAAFHVFLSMFMAMLLNPTAMKRAQEEIDSVIGHGRLPEFSDMESLPYVHALITEVLRWKPIVPTALAHSVIVDDVYEDMFIPKGSTIYANIHAMCLDEEVFPEPKKFLPERFLAPTDPRLANFTLSFGFGRRICPGIHTVRQSLFITIARILWAFDIRPPTGPSGEPILPDDEDFSTGLVIHPKPFEYNMVPRRDGIIEFLNEEARKADEEVLVW